MKISKRAQSVPPSATIRRHIVVLFSVSLAVSALLMTSCGTSSLDTVKRVRAEVDSTGNVIVTWDEVVIKRDLIGYNVYWSRDLEFPEDERTMASVSAPANSYTIRELEAGTWHIRVSALFLRTYDSVGGSSKQQEQEGPWSETAIVTIPSTSASMSSDSQHGEEFGKWGVSLTTPAQWQRWTSNRESALVEKALRSVDEASLKVEMIHLAGWSTADEAATMLLKIVRERSGAALRLSDVLARHERDDNRAKEYGDATQINRLEIGRVGGRQCVVHDVTLRAGRRMLTYDFIRGSDKITLYWVFRDDARFAESKTVVESVLQTLSFNGNPGASDEM